MVKKKNAKIQSKTKNPDKGISLALGGGGVRGFGHIGVLAVLEEEGIKVERLSGTSMGAIVAAMYSMGYSVSRMEEVALEIAANFGEVNLAPVRYFNMLHESILKSNFVEDALDDVFKDVRLEDCKIPLQIVAVDLETGKDVVYEKGMLRKLVRASSSIPVLLPPTFYHDRYLVDGGILNNVPLPCLREKDPAILMGVKLVSYTSQQYISGMVYAKYHRQKYKNLFHDVNLVENFIYHRKQDVGLMLGIAMRALDIASSESTEARIKAAKPDILLEPLIQCGSLEFGQVENTIKEGRRVTKEIIPKLKKLMKKKGLL